MCRLLTGLAVLIACAESSETAVAQSIAPASLEGSYYWGEGLGYNIALDLRGSGEYRATWDGCLGEYGTAEGRWGLSGRVLHFKPSKETGKMKGHLRSARVTHTRPKVVIALEDEGARTLGPDGMSKYPKSRRRFVQDQN